jgi:hypothetical protein
MCEYVLDTPSEKHALKLNKILLKQVNGATEVVRVAGK